MQSPTRDEPTRSPPPTLPLTTVDCPLCGLDRSDVVTRTRDFTYGVAGEYTVVRCDGCGHLFINPRKVSLYGPVCSTGAGFLPSLA